LNIAANFQVFGGTNYPLSSRLLILKSLKHKNVTLIFLTTELTQKPKIYIEQSFLPLQVLPLTLNQMLIDS
jgi:hypothetical protein